MFETVCCAVLQSNATALRAVNRYPVWPRAAMAGLARICRTMLSAGGAASASPPGCCFRLRLPPGFWAVLRSFDRLTVCTSYCRSRHSNVRNRTHPAACIALHVRWTCASEPSYGDRSRNVGLRHACHSSCNDKVYNLNAAPAQCMG